MEIGINSVKRYFLRGVSHVLRAVRYHRHIAPLSKTGHESIYFHLQVNAQRQFASFSEFTIVDDCTVFHVISPHLYFTA